MKKRILSVVCVSLMLGGCGGFTVSYQPNKPSDSGKLLTAKEKATIKENTIFIISNTLRNAMEKHPEERSKYSSRDIRDFAECVTLEFIREVNTHEQHIAFAEDTFATNKAFGNVFTQCSVPLLAVYMSYAMRPVFLSLCEQAKGLQELGDSKVRLCECVVDVRYGEMHLMKTKNDFDRILNKDFDFTDEMIWTCALSSRDLLQYVFAKSCMEALAENRPDMKVALGDKKCTCFWKMVFKDLTISEISNGEELEKMLVKYEKDGRLKSASAQCSVALQDI